MSHIPTFVAVGEGKGWGFIEFPGGGGNGKERVPRFRSPEVGISDSVEPKITRLAARKLKVNNTIHWINLYLVGNAIGFPSAG